LSRPQHEASGLRQITVRATNFDGTPHWEHPAWLVRADGGFVQTQTPANTAVRTEGDGYVSPYDTLGHYWTDRWFNVIRLETPGEGLFGYYCNIATPLEFDGATVHYVDLQLDVRVFADAAGALNYRIVDEDEFEEARERYAYAKELVERCHAAVDELVGLIEAREFPFDA
jgi:protein associated with RNAse G/E